MRLEKIESAWVDAWLQDRPSFVGKAHQPCIERRIRVRGKQEAVFRVQGREADAVILLLGAPKASQHRARQWAASPPNIINVAVSRAKQNLYVVGSATAWSAAGTSLQVLQRALT